MSGLASRWATEETLVKEAEKQDELASKHAELTHPEKPKTAKPDDNLKISKTPTPKQQQIQEVQEEDSDDYEEIESGEEGWEDEEEEEQPEDAEWEDFDDDEEAENGQYEEEEDQEEETFTPVSYHQLSADAKRLMPLPLIPESDSKKNDKKKKNSTIKNPTEVIPKKNTKNQDLASRIGKPLADDDLFASIRNKSSKQTASATAPTPKSTTKSTPKATPKLQVKQSNALGSRYADESLPSKYATPKPQELSSSQGRTRNSPQHVNYNNNKNEIRRNRDIERDNYRKTKINSGRDWDQDKRSQHESDRGYHINNNHHHRPENRTDYRGGFNPPSRHGNGNDSRYNNESSRYDSRYNSQNQNQSQYHNNNNKYNDSNSNRHESPRLIQPRSEGKLDAVARSSVKEPSKQDSKGIKETEEEAKKRQEEKEKLAEMLEKAKAGGSSWADDDFDWY